MADLDNHSWLLLGPTEPGYNISFTLNMGLEAANIQTWSKDLTFSFNPIQRTHVLLLLFLFHLHSLLAETSKDSSFIIDSFILVNSDLGPEN